MGSMGRFAVLLGLTGLMGAPVWGQSADEVYREANRYYEEYTWDRAIDGFQAFLDRFPGDPRAAEAEFKLIHAKFRLERWEEFEARLQAYVEKQRNTVWAARGEHLLATYYYNTQRWNRWEQIANLHAEALRHYRAAVGRRPFDAAEKREYVGFLFDAAAFYTEWWDERARDLAREHLESILAYDLDTNTNARALLMLAQLYAQRYNDAAKAEALLLRIVKEMPASDSADEALWRLAEADNSRGDCVRARARYLELRRRYPKSRFENDALRRVHDIEAPRLSLSVSRTHLPGTTIPTTVQTRNIGGVLFAAYRVDPFQLLGDRVRPDSVEEFAKLGTRVASWTKKVEDKGDYQYQQIKFDSPLSEPGLYVIVAVADGHPTLKAAEMINVSSLVLVQQYARRKLVSYVASRATRQPVAGVELKIARDTDRNKLRVVADGITDADGLLTSDVGVGADEGWRLWAVGRLGNEYVIQDRGLYAWWRRAEKALHGYIYTDRPVYRPGNAVHYRAILRSELEGRYDNLPEEQVEVTITDARGEEILKTTATTDAWGTIGGELTLGEEPPLGVYNIQIKFGEQVASGQFRVEEYRKPEFKVTVGAPLAEVRPGGSAAIPVQCDYYFGAPVADAEVRFVVQRRPYRHYYWFPGPWDWFYAGWREPPGRWWRQEVVAEGTTRTDARGQAIVEFSTLADGNDYSYSIYVEVADVTRRVVDATGGLTLTQKAFYLFARTHQGLYRPEDDVSLTVRAENPDGQPVHTDFTVACYALEWVPEQRDPKTNNVTVVGHYRRAGLVWGGKTLTTDPDSGEKTLIFKAPADGQYELEARAKDTFDPQQEVVTTARFWTASDAWKGRNYDEANLQLVTEKDLYERGETARLMIRSPEPDGAVLLTIGASGIHSTRVVRLQGNVTVIDLPIEDSYAPNIYLNAVMVASKQVYFANKELMVPPTDQLLKITVESDQREYKPRTTGTFRIHTADRNGRPVPAQVSLGITDDSVYAIQEEMASPIGVFFYGHRRYNEIRTAVSFEGYGEYGEERQARRGGGGPAGAAGAPPAPAAMAGAELRAEQADMAAKNEAGADDTVAVREFFPDTILWQPAVTTDADGNATVTVEFPDSLTTWRATARAITKSTQVAQQVANVVTSKDLIVRLQAPRFFTQLDESTISVVVTNKTSERQQVAVGLSVEGLQLVGGNEAVTVEPFGQARVDRTVRAVTPGEATITVTGRGPNDSDGVRMKFAVLPHGAEKFAAAAGTVGAEDIATFTLALPAERRDDATRLTITVAPTLVTTLLDALPYLVQYPYGCVEQTTSKFIPCVLVARILDYTGHRPEGLSKPAQVPAWWESRGLDALPDMVKEGIKRLAGMQNPDGGFGWFGGMRSDLWMTSYVVYGLTQARLADFTVPDEMLDAAVAHLFGNLHLLQGRLDDTAYVSWVLSEVQRAGYHELNADERRALEDAFQRVYANRDQLNDYTRALLCLGLVNRGERDKAEVCWRNIQAHRIETEHGVHWGQSRWGWRWSEDQVETTAFCLLAALAIEPDGPLAAKAVNWLVLNREGNHWYSTKDTATALFGLTSYVAKHNELGANYTVSVRVNGHEVRGIEVTPQNALTVDGKVEVDPTLLQTGDNRIEIVRDGQGACYYTALLEYYTREDPITAAANYIAAERKYYRVVDYTDPETKTRQTRREPLTAGQVVASGDQIEVEVTVDSENEFDYICLADPKPAGCEPVDQTSGGTWGGTYMYRELRDEAVTFFVDHLPQGKTTLTYRLRAESPGIFRALPHHGFSMYRPDVRCLSDEAIVRIGERPSGEG